MRRQQKIFYAIRHIPSGRLLATPESTIKKRGFTSVDIWDDGAPRLFTTEYKAKLCLGKWLEGVFSFDYDDGLYPNKPRYARLREEMEVIPVKVECYG